MLSQNQPHWYLFRITLTSSQSSNQMFFSLSAERVPNFSGLKLNETSKNHNLSSYPRPTTSLPELSEGGKLSFILDAGSHSCHTKPPISGMMCDKNLQSLSASGRKLKVPQSGTLTVSIPNGFLPVDNITLPQINTDLLLVHELTKSSHCDIVLKYRTYLLPSLCKEILDNHQPIAT